MLRKIHCHLQLSAKSSNLGLGGSKPQWTFSLNSHLTPKVPVCYVFLIIQQGLTETSEDKQGERILGSSHSNQRLRCYSGCQWQEDTHSFSSCPPTSPRMLPLPLLLPLSSFLSVASVQDLTAPQRRLFSFPWGVGFPTSLVAHIPPICPPRPPLYLSPSSPGLQTVQGFIYILLVEACHVSMHVPVVVADVALCTPIGHRAKPEWR